MNCYSRTCKGLIIIIAKASAFDKSHNVEIKLIINAMCSKIVTTKFIYLSFILHVDYNVPLQIQYIMSSIKKNKYTGCPNKFLIGRDLV